MKTFLDKHYKHIRKFRFLWGWAKDQKTKMQCAKRVEEWQQKGFDGAKLDICGGRNPYKPGEFLNVDAAPLPGVDLVFDITKSFPINDEKIQEIISIATLEHLRKHENMHVLQECFRVLKPGGTLQVSTPDMEGIAKGILEGDDVDIINQYMFGKFKGDETEIYDVHKWMFPVGTLKSVLEEIGFVNVERKPMIEELHPGKYNFLLSAEKPRK